MKIDAIALLLLTHKKGTNVSLRPQEVVQIVQTCKQSGYKQSGWAEPARLSNGQGWAGGAQARQAKQSSLRAAGAQKF